MSDLIALKFQPLTLIPAGKTESALFHYYDHQNQNMMLAVFGGIYQFNSWRKKFQSVNKHLLWKSQKFPFRFRKWSKTLIQHVHFSFPPECSVEILHYKCILQFVPKLKHHLSGILTHQNNISSTRYWWNHDTWPNNVCLWADIISW